jgi:hypothetical protein
MSSVTQSITTLFKILSCNRGVMCVSWPCFLETWGIFIHFYIGNVEENVPKNERNTTFTRGRKHLLKALYIAGTFLAA